MTERGIDVSNYQPVPSDADCAALVAAGFTFAIVGMQVPSHAYQQVEALRSNGITVEDCYLENTSMPPIPAGIKRGWVAVEIGSGFVTERAIDDQIAYLLAAEVEPGIYTSTYMLEHLGLTSLFASKYTDVPLWMANYDGVDDCPWDIAMKQYSGSGRIPGIAYELDLNARHDQAPTIEQEEQVDARPLDFDETRHVAEATYAQFSDVAIDQHGGGMYEITGDLPVVNGARLTVPDGGEAYLVVLPKR